VPSAVNKRFESAACCLPRTPTIAAGAIAHYRSVERRLWSKLAGSLGGLRRSNGQLCGGRDSRCTLTCRATICALPVYFAFGAIVATGVDVRAFTVRNCLTGCDADSSEEVSCNCSARKNIAETRMATTATAVVMPHSNNDDFDSAMVALTSAMSAFVASVGRMTSRRVSRAVRRCSISTSNGGGGV
jgi:hypothetical protein